VLDVYAAGETPLPGVSGRLVVERAHAAGAAHVAYAEDPADAVRAAVEEARSGDRVMVLGAGDVWKLAGEVLKGLRRQDAVAEERG